jgi:uncharacterized protein (TIGR00369 family)
MPPPATARYGIATPEDVAGLTGRAMLEGIIAGRLPQAPICETMNFWLAEVGDGFAAFEGEPGPHLRNPMGTVHGGWALTLIDSATACAGWTGLPAGVGHTTVETKANFSRPITADIGRVRCESRVVNQGRQIITCEGWIRSSDGRVLAHGTSTLLVLAARK